METILLTTLLIENGLLHLSNLILKFLTSLLDII